MALIPASLGFRLRILYKVINTAKVSVHSDRDGITECLIRYYSEPDRFLKKGGFVLEIEISDGRVVKVIERNNYFFAMLELRKKLENENLKLCCWGAKKSVWPTGMEADMGMALCVRDRDSAVQNTESIFASVPLSEVVTVEEQIEYIRSL